MDNQLPPLPSKITSLPPIEKPPIASSKGSKIPLLFFLFIIIGITGIATPLYFVSQSNKNATKRADSNTVVIDTANKEIKAALEKEFIYTASGPTNYYSPTIDSSFNIDTSLMYISEGGKTTSVFPKNTEGIYGDISIMDSDPVAYFKDYYEGYSKLVFTEPVTKDGYQKATFTYEKPDYLKKGSIIKVTINILFVKDTEKNKFFTIRITSYAPASLSASLEEQYVAILLSAKIAPTDVAPTITAALPSISAKVVFDKKKWSVNSQSNEYLSLAYITKKYEEPYVSFRVNGSYFYGEKNTAALEKLASQELEYAKKYQKNVSVITEKIAKTIGEQPTIGTSYSYATSSQIVYVDKYFGFAPIDAGTFEVEISKYIENKNTYGKTYAAEEISKILETGITFATAKNATNSDTVLGESTLTIEKPALIGKLGTVHLATTVCTDISINDPKYLPTYVGRKLSLCYSGTGSGFYVSSNGLIVTNAHVAKDNPFSSTEELFISTKGPVYKAVFAELYAKYLASTSYAPVSESNLEELGTFVQLYILQLIGEKKITFANTTYNNYLETDIPFSFDSVSGKLKNPQDYTPLTLVTSNTLTSRLEHLGKLIVEKKKLADNPYVLTVPDLAILKVENLSGSVPTLQLGNAATLVEGSSLLTIGFPGVADNRALFSDTSSMTATIAKGTVSAIKGSATNLFKLIQTDASINRGNSGGPMINNEGEVVGVSTYLMTSDGGNYGAGVSVEEVSKILLDADQTLEKSSITKTLVSAIDNMQKEYYSWALRDFDAVIAAYAQSKSMLQPLRQLAQEKIDNGDDNTPLFVMGKLYIHKTDLPFIIGGLSVALVTFVIFIIVLLKKKKRKEVTTIFQSTGTVTPAMGKQVVPVQPFVSQVQNVPIYIPAVAQQQFVPAEPVYQPEPVPVITSMPVAVPLEPNQPLAVTPMVETEAVVTLPVFTETPYMPVAPLASQPSVPSLAQTQVPQAMSNIPTPALVQETVGNPAQPQV